MASEREKGRAQLIAEMEQASDRVARLKDRISEDTDGAGRHSALGGSFLAPGEHACCLYSSEAERCKALAPFVQSGLEREHKTLCFPGQENAQEMLSLLEREGVRTCEALSSGRILVFDPADFSLSGEEHQHEDLVSVLYSERDRALRQGYAALRVACEMSRFFRASSDSKRLAELGAELSLFFAQGGATGLCLYDRRCFPADDLLEVLVAHPFVVQEGVCFTNTYYLPPRELVGQDRAEKELNRRLGDLNRRHRDEKPLRRNAQSYRQLFDHAPVGIFITDSPGRVYWLNSEMARILGASSPEEAMERYREIGLDLYTRPERREEFLDLLRRYGQVEHFEYEARHRKGGSVWLAMNARIRQWLPDGSFLIDGFVTDVTERRRSEKKIRHLNRILSAIRNVNQLITTERDRYRLVQGACDKLIESGGYNSAWVALFDGDEGACGTCVEAGTGEGFPQLAKELRKGDLPDCAAYALESSDVAVLRESDSGCSDCPLGGNYPGSAGIAVPLVHGDAVFGVMVLCLPIPCNTEEKERELVRELAGDIAFALHKLDLEDERLRAEKELYESERFLRSTLDGLSAHIAVLNAEGAIIQVNRAWRDFARANDADMGTVAEGVDYLAVCADAEGECSEGAKAFAEGIRGIISGESDFFSLEYPCPSPHKERWFIARANPFSEELPRRIVIAHEEITERKKAEQALRRNEARYRDLFQSSPVGIFLADSQGRPYFVNPAMANLLGAATPEEFLRRYPDLAADLHVDPGEREKALRVLRREERIDGFEFEARHLGGGTVWLSLHARVREWREDGTFFIDGFASDITERKRMEERLREMSLRDALTGLYNRFFFEEEMRRLSDDRYLPMGIIVCDVDGLKLINDTQGHAKGDEFLETTAGFLRRCFRSSDIIARIGGDEFAVLLPRSGIEVVRECCERIRREVSLQQAQFPEFGLSVSTGYAVAETPSAELNELFKRADDAMYKQKLQQSYSSRSETVQALIKTMEARDHITEGHGGRLEEYALQLGRCLELAEDRLSDLHLLARFHDLGKVGVPDRILFKPGPLTDDEYAEMKRHCEIGHRIALALSDLAPIADFILKHHEWWNGRGYPQGLAGRDIPLECRILSIADAYDAMTSDRPYRKALSAEKALRELRRCAGTQFDPELVELFVRIRADVSNPPDSQFS